LSLKKMEGGQGLAFRKTNILGVVARKKSTMKKK
jgi:hypothetical protein